ncbi:MAG: Fic family protein [Bacteroidota bacterium]
MELKIILQEINSFKNEIDELRPISPDVESRIMQKFRLDWNYHSNNIEGNKLTYGETKTFLLHGITANGKPLKDHLDIKGHNEVLLLLEDIIKEDRSITENFIRELHILILKESYYNKSITTSGQIVRRKIEIGKYKTQPNHVLTQTDEIHYFANPEETSAKMFDLIEWLKKINNDIKIHPLITASLFHYKFISIHPFDDGNGRLARILMNLILMQKGYPPVIIKTEKKEDYYRALQAADGGDENFFSEYIGEQLITSLELYLKGAKGENIDEITDVDKQIDLLKAQLNGQKEKKTIDKIQFIKIYQDIAKPLLAKTLRKLEKFDELFFSKKIVCWRFGGGNSVESIDDYFEKLDADIQDTNSTIGEISFDYTLIDFKKAESIIFTTTISLTVCFNSYDYLSIYSIPETFGKINISFENPIIKPEDELVIINNVAKYILDDITLKLNEINP